MGRSGKGKYQNISATYGSDDAMDSLFVDRFDRLRTGIGTANRDRAIGRPRLAKTSEDRPRGSLSFEPSKVQMAAFEGKVETICFALSADECARQNPLLKASPASLILKTIFNEQLGDVNIMQGNRKNVNFGCNFDCPDSASLSSSFMKSFRTPTKGVWAKPLSRLKHYETAYN